MTFKTGKLLNGAEARQDSKDGALARGTTVAYFPSQPPRWPSG